MKKYPKIVQEIHKKFETAGDILLKEANDILSKIDEKDMEKGKRLKNIGFANAKQVNLAEEQEAIFLENQNKAKFVLYYKQQYPFNKFIEKKQVEEICKKYNLVCAEINRYKGFVPDEKLKQIENFKVKKEDLDVDHIRITSALVARSKDSKSGSAAKIHKDLKLDLIPINHKTISDFGKPFMKVNGCYIEGYEIYSSSKLVICAPRNDMDLKGLRQKGNFFSSFTKIKIDDPVVLQSVKGGYLVVTAWGDEASDPIVLNPVFN